MMRKILYVLFLFGSLPAPAHAQETAAVSSARETAKSGIEDYIAGRYEAAHDKLSRAFEVVRVPTLALFNARALAKLGKLVEASAFYLLAMRLDSSEGDAETQEQARRDAKLERSELLKRIPRLRIEVVGARVEEVMVVANGSRVAPSLFATGWMINPGSVHVTAHFAGRQVEAHEQFAEAESKTITLRFSPVASSEVPRPVAADPTKTGPGRPEAPASYYHTGAWIGVGVAAAGLAFGTATGLWAVSERKELDARPDCTGTRCDAEAAGDQVDRYNRLRHLATTGFIVSAVGAAASAVLFVQDARQKRATQRAQISAWLGVGSAGIGGKF